MRWCWCNIVASQLLTGLHHQNWKHAVLILSGQNLYPSHPSCSAGLLEDRQRKVRGHQCDSPVADSQTAAVQYSEIARLGSPESVTPGATSTAQIMDMAAPPKRGSQSTTDKPPRARCSHPRKQVALLAVRTSAHT